MKFEIVFEDAVILFCLAPHAGLAAPEIQGVQ
jgi:hypothetical protein